jgi:hypothetical protein
LKREEKLQKIKKAYLLDEIEGRLDKAGPHHTKIHSFLCRVKINENWYKTVEKEATFPCGIDIK